MTRDHLPVKKSKENCGQDSWSYILLSGAESREVASKRIQGDQELMINDKFNENVVVTIFKKLFAGKKNKKNIMRQQ